jgi:hypothetical protein
LIWETFLVTLVNVGTVIESPPVPVSAPVSFTHSVPIQDALDQLMSQQQRQQQQRAPEVEALRRAVREDGMSRPMVSIAWPTPASPPITGGVGVTGKFIWRFTGKSHTGK